MHIGPTMPGIPPQPPEPPQQQPQRNNKLVAGVGMAVLVALGVGIFAGTWIDDDSTPKDTPASDSRPTLDALPGLDDVITDEPTMDEVETPGVEDVTINLKTKSKKCFGSAGCIITVEPQVVHLFEPVEGFTYEITYEIDGGEHGPITETLELDSNGAQGRETMVSTTSSSVVPEATVTDVVVW